MEINSWSVNSRPNNAAEIIYVLSVVGRLEQHSTKVGQYSVHDGDAAKITRVNCKWCEEKRC